MNIIMEHSHVNYPKDYEIVRDGRTLNALLNRGLIDGYDKDYSYVEYPYDRLCSEDKLMYNGSWYIIKYFEGCFMPFVCKVINNKMESK